jgi:hypothetical protein
MAGDEDLEVRVNLAVSHGWLRRVDGWRRVQPDLVSRSAAIRTLVEKALAAEGVAAPVKPAAKAKTKATRKGGD